MPDTSNQTFATSNWGQPMHCQEREVVSVQGVWQGSPVPQTKHANPFSAQEAASQKKKKLLGMGMSKKQKEKVRPCMC